MLSSNHGRAQSFVYYKSDLKNVRVIPAVMTTRRTTPCTVCFRSVSTFDPCRKSASHGFVSYEFTTMTIRPVFVFRNVSGISTLTVLSILRYKYLLRISPLMFVCVPVLRAADGAAIHVKNKKNHDSKIERFPSNHTHTQMHNVNVLIGIYSVD